MLSTLTSISVTFSPTNGSDHVKTSMKFGSQYVANSWTVLCSLHYFHILRQQPIFTRMEMHVMMDECFALWHKPRTRALYFTHLVIVHIQIVRCWEYRYKWWKTSCETLSIHSVSANKEIFHDDEWIPVGMTDDKHLTQHLELREHEWWIVSCCFARSHSTLGSCKSMNTRELCCVNKNRCFSHCRNLPTDLTITDRTLDRTLVVPWSGRAFECRPNLEFLATVHRARTRIAGSLMQLMANNRKHPCTHRKHVLNIWFYLMKVEGEVENFLALVNYSKRKLKVERSVKVEASFSSRQDFKKHEIESLIKDCEAWWFFNSFNRNKSKAQVKSFEKKAQKS